MNETLGIHLNFKFNYFRTSSFLLSKPSASKQKIQKVQIQNKQSHSQRYIKYKRKQNTEQIQKTVLIVWCPLMDRMTIRPE